MMALTSLWPSQSGQQHLSSAVDVYHHLEFLLLFHPSHLLSRTEPVDERQTGHFESVVHLLLSFFLLFMLLRNVSSKLEFKPQCELSAYTLFSLTFYKWSVTDLWLSARVGQLASVDNEDVEVVVTGPVVTQRRRTNLLHIFLVL